MDRNSGHLNRCPDARALLPGYVEGELTAVQTRGLVGHLTLCAACRQEEAQYRAAFGALKAARQLAPHRDLSRGLAAKLARYESRRSVRQLQLRWAGACCLVLAMGGASASYMRSHLTQSARVNPAPVASGGVASSDWPDSPFRRNPSPALARQTAPLRNTNPAAPKSDPSVDRDPFDPKSIAAAQSSASDPKPGTTPDRIDTERVKQQHTQKRSAIAQSEREDFLRVSPVHGASADQIIKQTRQEETVAQYAAPQTNDDSRAAKIVLPDYKRQPLVPVDPDDIGSPNPGHADPASIRPVTIVPEKDSEVIVNGKRTDVQAAMGYDKAGRPVYIKVNIGATRSKRQHDSKRGDVFR